MSTTNDIEALTGSSIIYENGRQGAILNALISSNDCRVLFLMQELDKLHSGSPVHSSPDSALLTLMDGCGFVDNYWDIAIPTDQIFCIATCNDPNLISAPLRDRFIEIKGPAYTRDEKTVIFEQFILPKAKEDASIKQDAFLLRDETIRYLVQEYATDPGVRDLERIAQRLVGHYLYLKQHGIPDQVYDNQKLYQLFGAGTAVKRIYNHSAGLAQGIFLQNGHASLFVLEAAALPGSGKLEITGPASAQQRDQARTAWLCVKRMLNTSFRITGSDQADYIFYMTQNDAT